MTTELKSNKEAVERICYELCETGRAAEAELYVSLSTGKYITPQEASDIRDSLIEDYPEYRDLM